MRLIDAEAFMENLKKFLPGIHQTYLAAAVMRIVKEVIDKQPTIEAKPVVHAHWEKIQYSRNSPKWCKYGSMSCSNCHNKGYERNKFCPHCGAQMDGTDTNVGSKGVKIPVISMEDVPKIMEEMGK